MFATEVVRACATSVIYVDLCISNFRCCDCEQQIFYYCNDGDRKHVQHQIGRAHLVRIDPWCEETAVNQVDLSSSLGY